MTAAGKRPVDIARHLGIKDAAVHQWFSKDSGPKTDRLPALAMFLGTTVNALLGVGNGAHVSVNKQEVRLSDDTHILPEKSDMPEDVPILGTALGGDPGGFVMLGETGFVRRPPRLAGRRDVFALFVQGSSMEPRYLPGELIYLEKRRPPQNLDHVVVEMKPGHDGVQEAYLKQLVGITPTKLRLRQYSPDRVIELDRKKVLQVIRVMTLADLF